jgi:hypothetical protein
MYKFEAWRCLKDSYITLNVQTREVTACDITKHLSMFVHTVTTIGRPSSWDMLFHVELLIFSAPISHRVHKSNDHEKKWKKFVSIDYIVFMSASWLETYTPTPNNLILTYWDTYLTWFNLLNMVYLKSLNSRSFKIVLYVYLYIHNVT